jgi:PAS domain S-box-containing protein
MKSDQQALQQHSRVADPPAVGNLKRSAGILAGVLLVYAVAISWYSWTSQMARAINGLTTIAILEARAIDSYFEYLKIELKRLGDDLPGKDDRIDLEQAYLEIKRFKELHPELLDVTLLHANGDVLLTAKSPPGIALASLAREASFLDFIEELKQGNPSGIGQPLVGVVSKTMIVPVRYAIRDRRDELIYIVSANLPHEHLRSYWVDAPITSKAAIGLMRDNGFLLSRFPVPADQPLDQIYGKPITGALITHLQQHEFPERGHVQGPSSLDGPDFLTAFQRLPNSPVTLFVAMPMSEIHELWLKTVSGTYFALLLFLVLGGFAAYRYALRGQYAESLNQQRLEATRRESDQRFRAILEASPVPSAVIDTQDNITYLNAAFTATFGYSQEEIPTMEEWWPKAYPDPEYRQWVAAMRQSRLEVLQRTHASFEPLELRIRTKAGDERTVLTSTSSLDPQLDGSYLATLYDITERKQSELALASAQEQLRSMFSAMTEGFVLHDRNGKVIDANPAAEEILGLTRDEILGNAFHDEHRKPVLEDGSPFPADQHPALVTLKTGQSLRNQIMGVNLPVRGLRWISINSAPIFTKGGDTPDAAITTFIDITARNAALASLHENEERFRQAFAQSPIGMLLCQLDGHVFKANAAFCRMSGYADSEIIGHRLGDLAPHASTADEEVTLFARIACGTLDEFSIQQEQVHKDGHVYVVQNSVSLVRSSSNAPLYCLAHVEDLTEWQRRQLEALAKQSLRVQEEERTRLSRELHDDVGQSLTALKLMLRRIQQNCGHGLATDCLRQATETIERLMSDVRAIAYRLRPSQLDDLGLMSSLRWHLDTVARPAGLEVVLNDTLGNQRFPEALELCCFRVAQEALTNVLKHARATRLEVCLSRINMKLLLSLRDNGIGFDVTRHYLVPDNSPSLGLIGMRERVATLNGHLEVYSSPGHGTEIRATFPLS